MKVNGSNYSQIIKQYKNNGNLNKTDKIINQVQKDRIEISSAGRDVKEYVERIKSLESNNAEKIEKIKASIRGGTYKISPEKLAKAMMDKIRNEKSFEEDPK